MTQVLTDIANDPWTKWELNTGAPAAERALRAIQGCAMIALAANMANLSAFGQSLDLKRLNSVVGTIRFGIYAHYSVHDMLGAFTPSKIIDPNKPACKVEPDAAKEGLLGSLPILNALVAGLFLHDLGVIDLGSQFDMMSSNFRGVWFAISVLDFISANKNLKTEEDKQAHPTYKLEVPEADKRARNLAQAKRKAILASIDLFLWMPAALFIGEGFYQGVIGIGAGSYGVWVAVRKAWENRNDPAD